MEVFPTPDWPRMTTLNYGYSVFIYNMSSFGPNQRLKQNLKEPDSPRQDMQPYDDQYFDSNAQDYYENQNRQTMIDHLRTLDEKRAIEKRELFPQDFFRMYSDNIENKYFDPPELGEVIRSLEDCNSETKIQLLQKIKTLMDLINQIEIAKISRTTKVIELKDQMQKVLKIKKEFQRFTASSSQGQDGSKQVEGRLPGYFKLKVQAHRQAQQNSLLKQHLEKAIINKKNLQTQIGELEEKLLNSKQSLEEAEHTARKHDIKLENQIKVGQIRQAQSYFLDTQIDELKDLLSAVNQRRMKLRKRVAMVQVQQSGQLNESLVLNHNKEFQKNSEQLKRKIEKGKNELVQVQEKKSSLVERVQKVVKTNQLLKNNISKVKPQKEKNTLQNQALAKRLDALRTQLQLKKNLLGNKLHAKHVAQQELQSQTWIDSKVEELCKRQSKLSEQQEQFQVDSIRRKIKEESQNYQNLLKQARKKLQKEKRTLDQYQEQLKQLERERQQQSQEFRRLKKEREELSGKEMQLSLKLRSSKMQAKDFQVINPRIIKSYYE